VDDAGVDQPPVTHRGGCAGAVRDDDVVAVGGRDLADVDARRDRPDIVGGDRRCGARGAQAGVETLAGRAGQPDRAVRGRGTGGRRQAWVAHGDHRWRRGSFCRDPASDRGMFGVRSRLAKTRQPRCDMDERGDHRGQRRDAAAPACRTDTLAEIDDEIEGRQAMPAPLDRRFGVHEMRRPCERAARARCHAEPVVVALVQLTLPLRPRIANRDARRPCDGKVKGALIAIVTPAPNDSPIATNRVPRIRIALAFARTKPHFSI